MELLRTTKSVCPVCLKQIPARKVRRDGQIYLEKECPAHGFFSTVVWRDREDFSAWTGNIPEMGPEENPHCPTGCGLCPDHKRDTCCVLMEITDRCNLHCRYCFADNHYREDPPLDMVKSWLKDLTVPGKTLVQLSGGEPTVREDLPEIIAFAKEAGCKYVQLNTNGLRLAEEPGYAKRLKEAGLSFVFLQFDGTGDRVWQKLRGRPLAEIKEQCIRNCGEACLGVTLVPTLVPGVNISEIGDIIRFAIKHSPAVRGVHFQPVSFLGHMPNVPEDADRFTLDELLYELERQAGKWIRPENLAPSACDHPLCGFHGDFVVMKDGTLMPLTHRGEAASHGECCCGVNNVNPADKNREFVGRRWERRGEPEQECCGEEDFLEENGCCGMQTDINEDCCCGTEASASETCCCGSSSSISMEEFLSRVKSHGFTVTAMAFQDAGNLDVERLRQCSLHVYKDGRHVPFCAYYLTPFPLP